MRREVRVEIVVPTFGEIMVLARRNQVPVQGLLGPVILAIAQALLPPGRYAIVSRPDAERTIEVSMCDADLVEAARAKLSAIAVDVDALALRPSLS